MDLSRILSPQDQPTRGAKRSLDGSLRPAQQAQHRNQQQLPSPRSTQQVLRSDPSNFHHATPSRQPILPNVRDGSPAHTAAAADSEMSNSTHYGSSPLYGLFNATNDEEYDALLDRIDGLIPEQTRRSSHPHGPGADIWQALERASSDASLRSLSPLDQSEASTMGQRFSRSSTASDNDQSSTFSGDSLFGSSQNSPPRQLGEIDLTQDSDPMSPPHDPGCSFARKRGHHDDDDSSGAPGPSNHQRSPKRPRTHVNAGPIESISLLDDDDDPIAASILSKQRADQMNTQNAGPPSDLTSAQGVAQRQPTKLTGMQCTICMDDPHELTATTCGHVFCRECIQGWLGAPDAGRRGKNCPACRTGLNVMGVGSARGGRGTRGTCVALEIMKRKRPAMVSVESIA